MTGAVDWKTLFISAQGRLARTPFLIAWGGLILVLLFYQGITGATLKLVTGWVVYPALAFIGTCVLSKRFHDRGKSGWYAALVLVAIAGLLQKPFGLLAFALYVVLIWAIVELGILGGEEGANRFGPNPLKARAA